MKRIIAFCLAFLFSGAIFAQDLPIGFAPGEEQKMQAYLQSRKVNKVNARGILTPPPFSNIRSMAEWEELSTLVITWTSFTYILREIVRNARLETTVTIVCSDSLPVKSYLTSGSVPLSNIKYLIAPFNPKFRIRKYLIN